MFLANDRWKGFDSSIEGNASDFSEEGSGRVMFLATRPEVSAAVKAPQKTTQDAGAPPKNLRRTGNCRLRETWVPERG